MAADERELTELESCVLGVTWQRGPCTAYVIRREFAISSSSHWSSSAGSIYPVLARLESLGLIAAEETAWGTGTKKQYRITPEGLTVLRAWIGPPLPAWVGKPTFDPTRTRMDFLGALTPAKRRRFVAEAERVTREELERFKEGAELQNPNLYERLAGLGTVYELEGRLRWLREVQRELDRNE
ncbi:MAG TPA: PadR family transcriptional regulator [Thermoanaerobaculia bacterium]